MKAVVHDRYGTPDVLRVEDVPVPSPAAGQVRVEVAATSVNLSDWECAARVAGVRADRRTAVAGPTGRSGRTSPASSTRSGPT